MYHELRITAIVPQDQFGPFISMEKFSLEKHMIPLDIPSLVPGPVIMGPIIAQFVSHGHSNNRNNHGLLV